MTPDPEHSDANAFDDSSSRPSSSVDPAGPVTDDDEELPLPTGTLFFMMIYLMVMAGMWGAIYFEFLGR